MRRPCLHQLFQLHGAVKDGVQFLHVADALRFRQVQKPLFQRFAVYQQMRRRQGVMELDRRAVFDRLGDGILVEVALPIVHAEYFEGALALRGPVNRRAGEADIGGIRQSAHQVVAEMPAGGTVGLIDQDDDVLAAVQVGGDVVKLVDHRHDQAAIVRGQDVLQLMSCCRDLGGLEMP